VIRRYRPGQSIGFHIDRLEKFEDAVWNVVVVNNDPSGGLQYQVDDNTKVPVTESPGLVSVQTGPARHTFKHGVPTVSTERISITWRWFRPAFLTSLADYQEAEARAVLSPFVSQVQRRPLAGTANANAHNPNRGRENSSDSSDSDNADSRNGASAATTAHLMAVAMPSLPPAANQDWSLFGMAGSRSAAIKLPAASAEASAIGGGLWAPQPTPLSEIGAGGNARAHDQQQPARSESTRSNSRVRARTELHQSWATRPRVGIISSSVGIIGQDASTGGKDHITRFCRALGHALSRSTRHEPELKNLALCLAEPPSTLELRSGSPTSTDSSSTSLPAVDMRSRTVGGAFRDGMKTSTPVVRGGAKSMDARATEVPVAQDTASVHILSTEATTAEDRFAMAANVYVMIEGGFSAADMARAIMENPDATVIRVGATGGAAAGYFDVKPERPESVPFNTWESLQSTVLSSASSDDELRRVAADAAKAVQAVLLHEPCQRGAKAGAGEQQEESVAKGHSDSDRALVKDVDVIAPSQVRIGRARATSATARGTAWPRGAVHRSSSNSRSPSLKHYSSSKENASPASCW